VFHLILAGIWLTGAIVVFAVQYTQGENAPFFVPLFGQRVSAAWIMLVLMLYNLAHWYVRQSVLAERQAMRAALEREMRESRRPPTEGGKEPDPNLRFTDDPPPSRSITDQPPPPN
jgi:hypothetical protein